MSEDEAKAWLATQFDVPRETWVQLERFVAILLDAMDGQNLIAESTRDQIWARHIVDSAQLLTHSGAAQPGTWMDLGSGAGLPGLVIAILSPWDVLLVESRRKRIDFLSHVVTELELTRTRIFGGRVEAVESAPAAVISARAYAPLDRLLASAAHLADEKTVWILPKGRNAQNELEAIRPSWQGAFHVEPSITDPDSAILVARAVKPAARRKGQG